MVVRLLAGYRLLQQENEKAREKTFFRFFHTQSFLCKNKGEDVKD